MRVYIDLDNLSSLLSSFNDRLFDDSLRMLKSQCELFFNFPKSILSLNKELMVVLTRLTDGSKNTPRPVFRDEPKPKRPIKSNFYAALDDREDLTAIYLLDDEKVHTAKSKGNLLIGGFGEEISTLSRLFYEDYQFTRSFTPAKEMLTWNILESLVLPCSDIIIVDPYLFSEEKLLDYNLHALLRVLVPKTSDSKIKLVIFTAPSYSVKDSNGKTIKLKPEWKTIRKNIIKFLKFDNVTAKVTIVASSKINEHDRSIFTNYYNLHSGDSFNYYDSKNNLITKGRHFTVHSHGSKENLSKGYTLIDDMQVVINNLKNENGYEESIIGDKESNFLRFSD